MDRPLLASDDPAAVAANFPPTLDPSANAGSATSGNATTGLEGLVEEGGDQGPACADQFASATVRPPVIQFVVDTSGSMSWVPGTESRPTNGEASKWDITAQALSAAVDAMPDDAAIGMTYYPNIAASGASCYSPNVAAPIAPLSASQRALIHGAIAAQSPLGGTPTEAAYDFGVQQLEATSIDGPRFVLLITDGIPTFTVDCGGDGRTRVDGAPLIAKVAARLANDGIRTFVIGSPGSEEARDELSEMATVGGTASAGCSNSGPNYCHFDMTQETDFSGALTRTLKQITQSTLACDYAVPAPPSGLTLDYADVSVVVESASNQIREFTRATSDACADGWQYSSDRKSIHLCTTTCGDLQSLLQTDPNASVRVKFGCSITPR